MNSRPLTYSSTDPEDPEFIIPNYLIKMSCDNGSVVPITFVEKYRFRRTWRYEQFLADEFWRRWTAEYIPSLLRIQMWITPSASLEVDDLVFVVDDLVPR